MSASLFGDLPAPSGQPVPVVPKDSDIDLAQLYNRCVPVVELDEEEGSTSDDALPIGVGGSSRGRAAAAPAGMACGDDDDDEEEEEKEDLHCRPQLEEQGHASTSAPDQLVAALRKIASHIGNPAKFIKVGRQCMHVMPIPLWSCLPTTTVFNRRRPPRCSGSY